MIKVERNIITGEVSSVEISDAVSIAHLVKNSWMICLDQTVIETVEGYFPAIERAKEIERDRRS